MRFSMFSAQCSPIAIDFGTSSAKLLQTSAGDKPELLAAAELPYPEASMKTPADTIAFLSRELPRVLRDGGFRGKKAVCSLPSHQTFVQHMQIGAVEGLSRDQLVKAQLQTQFGCSPENIVVRAIEVMEVHRGGAGKMETIVFAISKDMVMRYVDLLKRCKLDVVGVHTEVLATMRAFDHLHRRTGDENTTTLYVDIGYGGTKVAISRGTTLVFSKYIQIGGKHLDQHISQVLHCDLTSARAHRISAASPLTHGEAMPDACETSIGQPAKANGAEEAIPAVLRSRQGGGAATALAAPPEKAGASDEAFERRRGAAPAALAMSIQPGGGQTKAAQVDFSELLDAIADELSMCLRYHQSLFPGRGVHRMVFLGGEARLNGLCRHIAGVVRLTAQLGDPLARLAVAASVKPIGLTLGQPQPGWAVACGLCASPVES